jgi:phage gpG-like protein
MFAVQVDGLAEANARLDAYPAALTAALGAKATELAAKLADAVKNDKLSGGVLNVGTGALRDSIVANVSADADGIVASVGSEGDVKYAAIQEYGGKTSAHEILPQKAQALAFFVGGGLRFARRVEHPGSLIPARSYLGSALEDLSDEIVDAFADAATESWKSA